MKKNQSRFPILGIILMQLLQTVWAQVPAITSFAPKLAHTGETVTIWGTNFDVYPITGVNFGNFAAASYQVVSPTEIKAVVGINGGGQVKVFYNNGGVQQVNSAENFTFSALPTITAIYADYGGYWTTNTTYNSPVYPDNHNHLLAFTYKGATYSTGVNDSILIANGVAHVPGKFHAFPAILKGRTGVGQISGQPLLIAIASAIDGNTSATLINHPSVRDVTLQSVLSDGINGLDLGTGYTNLSKSATSEFMIYSIDTSKIFDEEPDIVVTQVADPSQISDRFSFVDANGQIVGNYVELSQGLFSQMGRYYLDLYSVENGIPFADAFPIGSSAIYNNTTRPIRMTAFRLSDFGIDASNYEQIERFIINPSGYSDVAFVAYNANAINVPPAVVRDSSATSLNVCNGTGGAAFLKVHAVTSKNTNLLYQWFISNNGGVTYDSLFEGTDYQGVNTNSLSVASALPGEYYRVMVLEEGTGLSSFSDPFVIVGVDETPLAGTLNPSNISVCLNTGDGPTTLSVNPSGGTGTFFYKWEEADNPGGPFTPIEGESKKSLFVDVYPTGTRYYRVNIYSGCLSHTSSVATVTVSGHDISSVTPGFACNPGESVTLHATATGGTIEWYATATGGLPLATGGSYNMPSLNATTKYFVSAYDAVSSCRSVRKPVVASLASDISLSSSNFAVSVPSQPCPGSPARANLSSPDIPDGQYTVSYSISGADAFGPVETVVTFKDKRGLLVTDPINNVGTCTITINWILTLENCTITPASGNTADFLVAVNAPDVSDLNISVQTSCTSSPVDVLIESNSLASGVYMMKYSVSGANSITSRYMQLDYTAGSPGQISIQLQEMLNEGQNVFTIESLAFFESPDCESPVSLVSDPFQTHRPVVLSLPNEIPVCETDVEIDLKKGTLISDYETLEWSSTDGTGSVQDHDKPNAKYIPSADDISAGQIQIKLKAYGKDGCPDQEMVSVLKFYEPPVLGSLEDADPVCEGEVVELVLNGNTGSVYSWESSPVQDFSMGVQNIKNKSISYVFTATDSLWFRAMVGNTGCMPTGSGAALVPVSPETQGGVLTSQTINTGQTPDPIKLSGHVGSVLEWHQSETSDFSSYDVIAVTDTELSPDDMYPLGPTNYFRAVVKSGECDMAYSAFGFIDDMGPLPVDLLYFKGECIGGRSHLLWETAAEINNRNFVVQGSESLHTWNNLAEVKGLGTSSTGRKYEWILPAGNSYRYFRLIQVDFDATQKIYEVISAPNCGAAVQPVIYPNPSKNGFQISGLGAGTQLEILNSLGSREYFGELKENEVLGSELLPGIYMLRWERNGQTGVLRIVVSGE